MTHTGEKPHCCPYCTHRSTFKSNITKHILRKHGVSAAATTSINAAPPSQRLIIQDSYSCAHAENAQSLAMDLECHDATTRTSDENIVTVGTDSNVGSGCYQSGT